MSASSITRLSKTTVSAVAPVYPSEDPDKVEAAVCNVFDGITVRRGFSVTSKPADATSLDRVRDAIRTGTESRRAYRRNLERNIRDSTTWFYLNKQAAFAGRVALCEEAAESPLGPIKITISSSVDPVSVIDWLCLMPAAAADGDDNDSWAGRR